MWIDCTISITIEKFDSCGFTKTFGQIFHSNEHKCVKNIYFVEYLLSFEWWQDLLEEFVLNFFLYVYQNVKWNQENLPP